MALRTWPLFASVAVLAACASTVAPAPDSSRVDVAEETADAPDGGIDAPVTSPDAPEGGLDAPVTPPDAPEGGLDAPVTSPDARDSEVATPLDAPTDVTVVERDDPGARCGASGQACCPDRTPVCDMGLVCGSGVCNPCPSGTRACGSACVNVANDPANCGACGTVCAAPMGSVARCAAGACVVSVCGPTDCDMNVANGLETNISNDACNCGACGHRCESLRGVASARCEACACRFTCHSSYGDCDGNPANGCEAPLTTDSRNCGSCGRACAAGQSCRGGACVDVPTYVTCAGRPANVRNDVEHCGACGRACAAGQVCDRGVCAASCAGASMRCGTETCIELGSNPLHCGSCGSQCPSGRACTFGRCLLGCSAGTTVCSGICTNLQTDTLNCGACGATCPLSAVCSFGVCQSRTCM